MRGTSGTYRGVPKCRAVQPLVARIHGDRTTVVVPNVRGFELDTLALISNKPWPPSKGYTRDFDIIDHVQLQLLSTPHAP